MTVQSGESITVYTRAKVSARRKRQSKRRPGSDQPSLVDKELMSLQLSKSKDELKPVLVGEVNQGSS